MPAAISGHPIIRNATNASGWTMSREASCTSKPAPTRRLAQRILRSVKDVSMLLLLLPELVVFERGDVVNELVAAAGGAGELIGFDAAQEVRRLVVRGAFFKPARAQVAVETLAVLKGIVQFDGFRFGGAHNVLHVEVAESADLGFHGAEHGVFGVAGVAGLVARDAVVLEVG